ncbi:hypothetical protein HGI81_01995 [Olsenella sp. KGMB02461]|nr:hypothetical protein [Olsenella sp. KGMB02461]
MMTPHASAAKKPAPSPKRPAASSSASRQEKASASEFCRAEAEDDDGYDPWSDRPPAREPLWEEDPWR